MTLDHPKVMGYNTASLVCTILDHCEDHTLPPAQATYNVGATIRIIQNAMTGVRNSAEMCALLAVSGTSFNDVE